jgi:hypothetical protein
VKGNAMKCIKEKCRYYSEHDFYESYFTCKLDTLNHKKVSDKDCLILDIIQDMEDDIINLKEYAKHIKSVQ